MSLIIRGMNGTHSKMVSLKSGACSLTIGLANGALCAMSYEDEQVLMPSSDLFSLSLLAGTRKRERKVVAGAEFSTIAWHKTCDGVHFSFSGCFAYSGLTVVIRVRAEDGFFFFRPEVSGVPDDVQLEWFDGPHVRVSRQGRLFWPFCDGVEVRDFSLREKDDYNSYRPLEYFMRGHAPGGMYPGFCQMQFMAWYNHDGQENSGVCPPN